MPQTKPFVEFFLHSLLSKLLLLISRRVIFIENRFKL
jgi:hypothetical protein